MEVSPSFSIMEYLASLEYNPHVPRPTDAGATLQSIRNDSHNTAPCPSLHTDFVLMMDLSTTRLKPLCDRKVVCFLLFCCCCFLCFCFWCLVLVCLFMLHNYICC